MERRHRAAFYHTCLDQVKHVLFDRLATCDGTFRLWQREVAPRLLIEDKDVHMRKRYYFTVEEIMGELFRLHPATLQFGAIYPLLGVEPGAVYAHESNGVSVRDFEREDVFKKPYLVSSPLGYVVLDVDMSDDYARVCPCATDKDVCDVCWREYMDPAQDALETMLDYLGFKGCYFKVFSGRRGFHIWLVAARVVHWTRDQRARFVDLLSAPRYTPAGRLEPMSAAVETALSYYCVDEAENPLLLWPRLDKAITADPTHLVGVPLTCHQATGLWRAPMAPVRSTRRFVPSTDRIPGPQVRDYHMEVGRRVIAEALDKGKKKH